MKEKASFLFSKRKTQYMQAVAYCSLNGLECANHKLNSSEQTCYLLVTMPTSQSVIYVSKIHA
jgi:hypothetical protein